MRVLFWSNVRSVWIVQVIIVTSRQLDFKVKVQERGFWGGDLSVYVRRICVVVKAMIREGEESKIPMISQ